MLVQFHCGYMIKYPERGNKNRMKKIENSKLALGLSNVELDSIESKDSGLVSSIVAYSRIKAPSTEYAVLEIVEYLCGRVHTSRKMSLREASDLYDRSCSRMYEFIR